MTATFEEECAIIRKDKADILHQLSLDIIRIDAAMSRPEQIASLQHNTDIQGV